MTVNVAREGLNIKVTDEKQAFVSGDDIQSQLLYAILQELHWLNEQVEDIKTSMPYKEKGWL
jgi:hypothetical protein